MNENTDFKQIPTDEYEEMLDDIKFLRALEAAGVDNWEGYEAAQDMAFGE